MHRKHGLDALIFFLLLFYFILLKLTEIGSLDCQTNAICLFDFLLWIFIFWLKLSHALMDDSCMFLREPLITNIMWRNLLIQVDAIVYLLVIVYAVIM